MTRLRWHPEARRELVEAAAFYEERSAGLGTAFLDRIELHGNRVRRHPRAGAPVGRACRRILVAGFPYSLIYRLTGDEAEILAVAHHKRRPRYWSGR